MKFSAVILAGGRSSRMGRDKAWLEMDGQPLLARQVQLAHEAGASEVLISGRTGADYSSCDCRVLLDRLVDAGPLGGIERSLVEAGSGLVLVLAVDMPKMAAGFLRQLLLRCEDGVGAIPKVNGEIEPLAAIYPTAAVGLIEDLLSAQRQSGLRGEVACAHTKSPSATAFAEKCVECGLA